MTEISLPPQSSRSKFPGMRPQDAQILRLWLLQHEWNYDGFQYNVRIGPGRDPGPSFSDEIRRMAVAGSQLRIDCIAWRDGVPTLIEVKNFAQDTSLTQLGLYAAVWRQQHPSVPVGPLLVVCTGAADGVVQHAMAAGITVVPVRQVG